MGGWHGWMPMTALSLLVVVQLVVVVVVVLLVVVVREVVLLLSSCSGCGTHQVKMVCMLQGVIPMLLVAMMGGVRRGA
jgi:hypothetical protein